AMTSATIATKVKSRVWCPSPSMTSGSPARAQEMNFGTTAAYACSASCIGPNTLKKRSANTGRSNDDWYASANASAASLLAPYGLTGRVASPSCFGSTGLLPYTDDDDATTTCGTGTTRRAASSTWTVPVALAVCEASGSDNERGTDGRAARWTTASVSRMRS